MVFLSVQCSQSPPGTHTPTFSWRRSHDSCWSCTPSQHCLSLPRTFSLFTQIVVPHCPDSTQMSLTANHNLDCYSLVKLAEAGQLRNRTETRFEIPLPIMSAAVQTDPQLECRITNDAKLFSNAVLVSRHKRSLLTEKNVPGPLSWHQLTNLARRYLVTDAALFVEKLKKCGRDSATSCHIKYLLHASVS